MTVFRITDVEGMSRALREDCFDNPEVGYPHESVGMDGYVTIPQIVDRVMTLASVDDDGERYISGDGLDELERWIYTTITESSLARLAAWDVIETLVDQDGTVTFERKQEEVTDEE